MITLEELGVGYGGQAVLSHLSLSLEQGKITTLIGPNGCGKSTLLRTMARLLPPVEGTVSIHGKDSRSFGRREFARLVSVLPQARDIPALETEAFVAHGRYPHLGFGGKLTLRDHAIIQEAMEKTGTLSLRGRELSSLSGGERQRVYLAMCLAQDTEILLLDEPTTYLDIGQKYELLELLQKISEQGKTIVLVLHDLSLAFSYSHNVVLLAQEKMEASGTARAVFQSKAADKVFAVSSAQISVDGNEEYVFYKKK